MINRDPFPPLDRVKIRIGPGASVGVGTSRLRGQDQTLRCFTRTGVLQTSKPHVRPNAFKTYGLERSRRTEVDPHNHQYSSSMVFIERGKFYKRLPLFIEGDFNF